MKDPTHHFTSRREFLVNTGRLAAASALAGTAIPYVHATENNAIQVALIGCGGRGTGAAQNALSVKPENGPTKLVAMADVFQNRLNSSYNNLQRKVGDKVDVPAERKFIGFDAYQKAMDCLRPGDVAIFTTPLAFRWVHFGYAISKGLNVFMEKPLTADAPTSRRMLKLADEAVAKNLKCGVGLMSRHSRALQELQDRIQNGEIGDVIFMRGYRMQGGGGTAFSKKWPGDPSELLWQIRRFHSFLWASGGAFSDFNIHIIDHLCWMKNDWPIKAQGVGARHYKEDSEGRPYVDQNFDNYAVEYTFPDGARMLMEGRCMTGCNDIYSSYVHGSKGIAVASAHGDCGMPSSIFKGQNTDRANRLWASNVPKEQGDPYTNEWNDLIEAIRGDKPYNEVKRGVQASAVTSMGRMAVHTGQEIEYEDFLNSTHEYAPDVARLTFDSPAPLTADSDGKYPIPMPGIKRNREY
jgi:predicted dehydrogenase